jgi:putative endonuclease
MAPATEASGLNRRMPAWCVYILRCRDGSLYTGATNDLPARLAVHRAGRGGAYTRSRLPVRVVYAERVRGRSAALRREWELKQLPRPEKLALVRRLAKDWGRVARAFGLGRRRAPGR